MKKILSVLLILTLCVGLIACGGKKDNKAPENTTASTDVTSNDIAKEDITPELDADTVGAQHWDAFVSFVNANPDASAEEIAANVVALEINQFMSGAMPVEEGLLSGFDNYEVKGFKSGAMFGPMMGSIAYVGYIFELEDGADAGAFIDGLTANANPRWQICVTADQTVAGSVGNKVFFLMCPETYEVPEEALGDEETVEETAEEGVETETTENAVVEIVTDAIVSATTSKKDEEPAVITTTVIATESEEPVVEVTSAAKEPETTEPEVTTPAVEIIAPAVDAGTVGGKHWNKFLSIADSGASAEEIAASVVALDINQFMSGSMPVEEGLLSGFDNYEVKGFKSGAMFGPMMGSIAYVGYIFELEDGADVGAFINGLTANANPRWQICVTADQTVAGAYNNLVFFLMCPETYEVPDEAYNGGEIIEE